MTDGVLVIVSALTFILGLAYGSRRKSCEHTRKTKELEEGTELLIKLKKEFEDDVYVLGKEIAETRTVCEEYRRLCSKANEELMTLERRKVELDEREKEIKVREAALRDNPTSRSRRG